MAPEPLEPLQSLSLFNFRAKLTKEDGVASLEVLLEPLQSLSLFNFRAKLTKEEGARAPRGLSRASPEPLQRKPEPLQGLA